MKRRFMSKLLSKGSLLGLTAFALGLATIAGLNIFTKAPAAASDCSANAIMKCGTTKASDFISKTKSSNGGTQKDLATIYDHYGLAPSDYSRFVTSAREGLAYKDGRIVVDGRTVATNAQSIGRQAKSYSHAVTIGGKTYYESRAQDVFLSNTIRVMVLFNAKGQMEFAVMYDCGNPTRGTLNNPTYKCNNLKQTKVNDNTFDFTASASAGNGASIAYATLDFGDGTTPKKISASQVNGQTKFRHVYTKTGSYKAKLTVYVNVPGAQVYTIAAAGDCVQTVKAKVLVPAYACSALLPKVASNDKYSYHFAVKATVADGAKITKVVYNFGDGKTASESNPKSLNPTPGVNHKFTTVGKHTIKATVTATPASAKQTKNDCTATITIPPTPTYACSKLIATPSESNKNVYHISVNANVTNGAKITKVVYTFSDGGTKTETNPSKLSPTPGVNYTFKSDGKQTVKATVTATPADAQQTKNDCSITFTIPPTPTYACSKLVATPSKSDKNTYHVSVKATVADGAKITKVVYKFSDGGTKTETNPSKLNPTPGVNYTFAKDGKQTIKATVTATPANAKQTKNDCEATVTVPPTPMPTYACSKLNFKASESDKFAYHFSVNASVTNGAKITKVVYNFGDGTTATETNPSKLNPTAGVDHIFTKDGKQTVKVTITATPANAKQVKNDCEASFTIPPTPETPTFTCVKLNAIPSSDNKYTYTFSVNAEVTGNAKITAITYDFGDGTTYTTTNPATLSPSPATPAHTFAAGKTYNVTARVVASPESAVSTGNACEVPLTFAEVPTCPVPGKENLPPDSPDCYENCPIPGKENLPKDSADCKEAPLPSTGAAGTASIFAGVTVLGSLGHYFIRSRRYGDR